MSKTRYQSARRVLAVGFTAILGVTVAACSSGGNSTSSGAVASISVADYYTDEPAKSIIGEALSGCGAAAGVSIERESIPSADLVAKTLQKVSARTLPDIQMFDNTDLPALAATGALQVLSDAGVATDNLGPGALQLGTVDDKVYGAAPTLGTLVMFYNVDLLNAAGITTAPTTWEELKTAAAKLKRGDTYGVAFSAKNNTEGTYVYLPLLWSGGGREDDLDSEAAERALQLEVDLVKSGAASQSVVQWGNSDVGDQFATGKSAIVLTSSSQMAKFDKTSGLNYQMATIPIPSTGDTSVAPLGGEVWTLPLTGDSARQAKAAEVLSCLMSDETQMTLAVKRGAVPANPALDSRYLTQLPAQAVFVDQVRNGRSRTALLGAGWADASTKIYTAVQAAITGQSSVSEALKNASR